MPGTHNQYFVRTGKSEEERPISSQLNALSYNLHVAAANHQSLQASPAGRLCFTDHNAQGRRRRTKARCRLDRNAHF